MSEFYLSDVSPRDRPWDYHRELAVRFASLCNGTELQAYSDRVNKCALWLDYELKHLDDDGELVFRLQSARFCRVRYCPVCQWRRSLMWKARFLSALPSIKRDYPKARWLFLTLTVENCEILKLRETIHDMGKSFIRLSKRSVWPAIGFIKSVEVTRSDSGYAHPHFHVLLLVEPGYFKGQKYLSHDKWVQLWKESLRVDYDPWVHVQVIKSKSGGQDGTELLSTIAETLKYSVKGDDLVTDQSWLISLVTQMHKVRTVSVGGGLRDYLRDEDPDSNEDLIHGDDPTDETDSGERHWWFDWRGNQRRYIGSQKDS